MSSSFLRREPVGGGLLLVATVIALVWANSPLAGAYEAARDFTVGPAALHLDLSVGTWAADGLLAVFFFVVGLELKQELVTGSLRDPRRALVPIVAAAGGVVVPALVYLLVTTGAGGEAARGWAVPAATDIAFALAVLAVVGRGLPSALRLFLLTLAVVDDLFAIAIIAVVYTEELGLLPLVAALAGVGAFALLARRAALGAMAVVAVVVWVLVHESGVHATVAGVLLGLVVPARGLAPRLEHAWRPWSAGLAVPVFALFSAGVPVEGLGATFGDPIALGVIAGLVVGKPVGITLAAWLTTRLTSARLDDSLTWTHVLAVATLAGMGFTVALLVAELAFGAGTAADDHAKVGILVGSTLAAVFGAGLLRRVSAPRRPGR